MPLPGYNQFQNLLHKDGSANYFGTVLTQKESIFYFNALFKTIQWENDEGVIYGKRFITKRKTAWYGSKSYPYTYSRSTKIALPWTKELIELKSLTEQICGHNFNSCLLNLYHDGNEGMAWHSDDEKEIVRDSPIASLSLGAERKFSFKHKNTKETLSLVLENGSLLVMGGQTQTHWMHSLPKSKKSNQARINLTFRQMIEP